MAAKTLNLQLCPGCKGPGPGLPAGVLKTTWLWPPARMDWARGMELLSSAKLSKPCASPCWARQVKRSRLFMHHPDSRCKGCEVITVARNICDYHGKSAAVRITA